MMKRVSRSTSCESRLPYSLTLAEDILGIRYSKGSVSCSSEWVVRSREGEFNFARSLLLLPLPTETLSHLVQHIYTSRATKDSARDREVYPSQYRKYSTSFPTCPSIPPSLPSTQWVTLKYHDVKHVKRHVSFSTLFLIFLPLPQFSLTEILSFHCTVNSCFGWWRSRRSEIPRMFEMSDNDSRVT